MAAPLTRETWRAQIAQRLAALAADPQRALADAGVNTLYGFLLGSVILPLAAAAAGGDPATILTAVTGLAGGIGANLVSELIQRGHDDATRGAAIAQLADDPATHPALQQLVAASGVFELVTSALAGHTDQLAQLRAELQLLADRFGSTGPFAGTTLTNNVNQGQTGGVNLQNATIGSIGEIVGGNKTVTTTIHTTILPATPDLDAALRRYLGALCDYCDALPLLDPGAVDASHPPARLAAVFVALDTEHMIVPALTDAQRQQVEEFERTFDVYRKTSFLYADLMRQQGIDAFQPRPQRLLAAIAERPRLVVTGDPGGGKSSALNFLALCLAHVARGYTAWRSRLAEAEPLAELVPIRIVLREFAAWLETSPQEPGSTQLLWDFLATQPTVGAALATELTQRWERGTAMLLLDGLDEVPADRHGQPLRTVRASLASLLHAEGTGRVVITCRTLDYAEDARPLRRLARWPVVRIAPLSSERRAAFVRQWFAALAQLGHLAQRDPDVLEAGMVRQIRERDELRRLAANPLLLTMMAQIQAARGVLPGRRVEVYEECLTLLWAQWRPLRAGELTLRARLDLAPETPFDHGQLLDFLGHVAHDRGISGDGEQGSDLPRNLLVATAASFFERYDVEQDEPRNFTRAEVFANYVASHGNGIVQQYGPALFRFPHRTFQEYLAARYLTSDVDALDEQGTFEERALARLARGSHWREAILLAVSRLNTLNQARTAGELAQELAERADSRPDSLPDRLLLADVLRELGRESLAKRHAGLWQAARDGLQALVEHGASANQDAEMAARQRIAAAQALGELGDERVPVSATQWHAERFDAPYTSAGTHYWRAVSGGTYGIGGWRAGDPETTLQLAPFWVARFPVTVAQYALFVKEGYGADAERFWTPQGWGWKELEPRAMAPWGWGEPVYNASNQPAIGMSWYEAMAFCAWLSERLRDQLPPDYVIRLPTDAEWEVAAAYAGSEQRTTYPWGDRPEPTPELAVYDWYKQEGRPAPIGTSPGGRAACGAEDLAGNVWEWTATRSTDYPARANGGLADMEPSRDLVPEKAFTVRGGSTWNSSTYVRCGARDGLHPGSWDVSQGLRLFVAPRSLIRADF